MQFSIDPGYADFFDLQAATADRAGETRDEFRRLVAQVLDAVGATPAAAGEIARELGRRMTRPELHYHTPVHLLVVLSTAQRIGAALDDAALLAILFHDVIYDVRAGAGRNEEASAELLLKLLTPAGVATELCERAAESIRWTARHSEAEVPAEHRLVLDLDLAGLASDPASFRRQSDALRAEMQHLAAHEYHRSALALLRAFLGRARIYRTAVFEQLEGTARANVAGEVRRLEGLLRGDG